MANKFYDAGPARAARVNDLFATVAPRYDLINDLQSFGLHRLWKRRLIEMADPRTGERALDLCCGTGDLAFALARRGAEVIGLDFSGPMLAVAGNRANARRLSSNPARLKDASPLDRNPRFIQGDALELPFSDSQFEIVTLGYGLRNLASWESGLQEMFRVARPGGRLLILDFGKPDNALWRKLYFTYLRLFVPALGKVFCGDSQTHAYILKSLEQYPAQRGVAEKMRAMNCRDLSVVNLLGGVMSIHSARKP